ncbi:hypothetical protein BD310DRAFT_927810 [Dichomitus squalens]|uniref:Secreted protein n=1 Tax=Dichomitus squalens TaxID=114155 RepID=A0A4Q9PUN3_9APHY|nr:hypothetical protein BD310DRAFT_927810 [Dichomitus squalens]
MLSGPLASVLLAVLCDIEQPMAVHVSRTHRPSPVLMTLNRHNTHDAMAWTRLSEARYRSGLDSEAGTKEVHLPSFHPLRNHATVFNKLVPQSLPCLAPFFLVRRRL